VADLGFAIEERTGSVEHLVRSLPDTTGRLACLCRPTEAGLVIGSSQPEESVDTHACASGGYAIVRRRSGGGAVVVAPGAQVWVDIFVPADDPLHEADVNRATHHVGEIWRAALATVSPADVDFAVHVGANETNEFTRRACFAGIGPGEVHLGNRKVVGLSQRRSRAGAWFFSMALIQPRHRELPGLLHLTAHERARLEALLENDVAVLDHRIGELEDALRAVLGGE
jgi:lipoate---protein ligase